jgi:hypothetical protein
MAITNVLVRVQAKGGKFLGPDAGYSLVTISAGDTILAQGIAEGGSGTLSGSFSQAATRQAIVTQQFGTQTVLWLSATPGEPTAGLTAAIDLAEPTLVTFTAEAITNDTPNGHLVSQTMWLQPGEDLTAEPGVVLVMPGLIVDVQSPASGSATSTGALVKAWVTMMCGCRIDPTLPWQPSEFTVTASFAHPGGSPIVEIPLTFEQTSVFGMDVSLALPEPGDYTVTVTALQPGEGNVGTATSAFTVNP